ncbi:MAG: hypothetical protein NT062_03700, partial [Proteobacteria bacterium]|nr:hypothetical protein [Pseudomonadota bacterium]
VTLGERATRAHHVFDAAQCWELALQNLPAPDVRRATALLGRARARQRLQRLAESLGDLDEALAIADALTDATAARELVVAILLERATTHDLKEDYAAAAASTAGARVRSSSTTDPVIALRLALAEGRARFRDGDLAGTSRILQRVIADAHAASADAYELGDILAVAELLLGPTLVDLGEIDAAAVVFADLVARCERSGDRFHLGAAYGNRAWLSFARGDIDGTQADLRLVIQIARESGQAHLERAATHNLAEDRLWQGSLDEALALVERSLAIVRAHEGAVWLDQLLLARIHAARDDRGALAPLLDTLAAIAPATTAPVLAVLRCVVDGAAREGWEVALAGLEPLTLDTRCELAHLALDRQMLTAATHAHVLELAKDHPIWSRRLH